MGAVLLGRLGHQADVGHRAHRGRVEGAVGAAVVDDGLVDPGVRRVGDHREGVGLLAVGAPHVTRGADHRRHRGVDDDVAGHVQVGDALVGVDHRQGGAVGESRLDGGLDRVAVGQPLEPARSAPRPSLGLRPAAAERSPCCAKAREERLHDMAEDDRVGDLHHRRLEVHGEQHVLGLGPGDLLGEEAPERRDSHEGGVDDLAGEDRRSSSWSTVSVPSVATCSMRSVSSAGDDHGLLVGPEVVLAHGGDVGLGVGAPGAHRVRVRLGVVLHRGGCAAVGVALAQHRVDRGALDLVVAGADVLAPRRSSASSG